MSMISQKNIWIHPAFLDYVIFLKKQTFQAHFCKKQTLFQVVQLVKTCPFHVQLINIKNVFSVFNICSVKDHFYVK